MQVRCIKAFGMAKPARVDEAGKAVAADVVEVPDGAVVDPDHWEVVPDEPPTPTPPPAPAPSLLSAATVTPKEGM